MKRFFYAPAAVLATVIFFTCEVCLIVLGGVVDACYGIAWTAKRLPNDFKIAYDEFLEN